MTNWQPHVPGADDGETAPARRRRVFLNLSRPAMPRAEWLRHLRPVIYLACGLAFLTDLMDSDTLAFGVFYIPLVCTAVLSRNRRSVWWLAGISVAMVVVGAFIPSVNPDHYDLIGNRALSVAAILATAALVSHTWRIRECLTEQTRRAAAAEKLKTEIFTNLGYDLRQPLHAIVGLTQLMAADCRSNQREPLGHVQLASRRLLSTINNLVDLTRFEERAPRSEPVDINALLQRAIEDVRHRADDGQVAVVTDIAADLRPLTSDAWAARRIVENILDNAVKFTPPGGSVKVSAAPSGGAVAVTVTDTGEGMPEGVLSSVGQPLFQVDPEAAPRFEGVGTGLALSRQLADAIGAELQFESAPGMGTSATLRFPVAGGSRAAEDAAALA
jgi:signal transduction histidine kinase